MAPERQAHELPFYALVAFCLVSPLSIAATNAAWIAALVLWIFQARSRRRSGMPLFHPTPLDMGFALLALAALLSLWTSVAPGESLIEFRSLGLIAIYYLFAWSARTAMERRILAGCLLTSAAVAALYGIGEFVTGRDFLGHYDPRVNMVGGFFSMHLTFGEYLVLAVSLAAGILLWARTQGAVRVLLLILLVLLLTALRLSWAKAAYLGAVAAGAVLLGLRGRRALLAGTVLVCAVLLAFSVWKSGALLREFTAFYRVDSSQTDGPANSNTQRLYMWWTGLRASPAYFLTGVGLHAVDVVYPSFRHPLAQDPTQWHLHNNFLQVGVETGMFGLAAFLYFFLLAGRQAHRRFREHDDPWEKGLSAAVLAALVGFLVSGLTEYSWADSEVLMVLYLLLGLGLPRRSRIGPKSGQDRNGRGRLLSVPGTITAGWGATAPLSKAPAPASRTMASVSGAVAPLARLGLPHRTAFVLLCLGVLCLPFLVEGTPPGTWGVRSLEVTAGITLMALGFAGAARRYPGAPWLRQAVACLVVFAGYQFTQPLWAWAALTPAARSLHLPLALVLLAVHLLVAALLVRRAARGTRVSLFDLAVFGSAWVWLAMALGTNALLRLAGGKGGLLDPPFPLLLLLCTLVVLLYGAVRCVYRGGRLEAFPLAAVALFLVLHGLGWIGGARPAGMAGLGQASLGSVKGTEGLSIGSGDAESVAEGRQGREAPFAVAGFGSIGPASLDYVRTLPVLKDLVICREASCHDRRGGNDNGFSNKAEFIRKEGLTARTILEVAGPGCINSFWFSWLNKSGVPACVQRTWARMLGRVEISFDEEPEPRLAVRLSDLVGTGPFVPPLAVHGNESAGGYSSYVPMPFENGVRIVVEGGGIPMFFYHLWYHTYPLGTPVQTWTGREDLDRAAALWEPPAMYPGVPGATPGLPSPAVPDRPVGPAGQGVAEPPTLLERQAILLPPHGAAELLAVDRPGTILAIRMKLPEDDRALRSTWLLGWWDEDDEPSLDAPLSLLFAVENRFSDTPMAVAENAALQGLIVGQDSEGCFFLRLPMPFGRQARLVLVNRGGEPVHFAGVRIEFQEGLGFPGLGTTVGYLHTQFRESRDLALGRDYLLAEIRGRGHIVGTVLSVADAPETFLEGDERIYTDGCRSPLVAGDATETYFGGSWYFCERAVSCPLTGAPTFRMAARKMGSISEVTMYRFHVTDFVPYRSEARFSIQHGPFNDVAGHYRSLVFYYGLDEPGLSLTDRLRLADAADLQAHGFSGAAAIRQQELEGFFEGEFNGQDLGQKAKPGWLSPVTWMIVQTFRGMFHDPPPGSPDRLRFTVCEHAAPYEFSARTDPAGRAVLLRRLFDRSIPDQRARIEVDGRPAGIWFNAGRNRWKVWAEDDLILDPTVTAGKQECRIRVVPLSPVFSAAEYQVFSIAGGE